jgi:hypothetical protein
MAFYKKSIPKKFYRKREISNNSRNFAIALERIDQENADRGLMPGRQQFEPIYP